LDTYTERAPSTSRVTPEAQLHYRITRSFDDLHAVLHKEGLIYEKAVTSGRLYGL
jgi:hypothetical protein